MGRLLGRRALLFALPVLAIPLVVSGVFWTRHVASEGEHIAANVRLVDVDVSGLDLASVAEVVDRRAEDFLSTPVILDLGERKLTVTAEELGYRYLESEVIAELSSARHDDDPVGEFVAWASTPFETMTVDDRFVLDTGRARRRLGAEDLILEQAVEPRVSLAGGTELEVTPGENGRTVDVEDAIAALAVSDPTEGPVAITPEHTPLPPEVTDFEAEGVAETLNRRTRYGLVAVLEGTTASIPSDRVRPLLEAGVEDGELVATVDMEGLAGAFEEAFPQPVTEMVAPVFDLVEGRPLVVTEGEPPTVCCSAESVAESADWLLRGGRAIYVLEPRPDDDPRVLAWATGAQVTEAVAEFTTRHACCENRVTNIHTIADAVRGYYLVPGATLSLNEHVGPRTREKGYLPAGAIRGGHMTDEVGGGVSQFSTTMFNAAYFAGLDLDQYQSHSVYFSRYPFGREATLSMPGPDLAVTNSTDYPVLIWPTYDDTSITVTIYSTKNVEVVELDQRLYRANQCRRSEIDRQRTFSNGSVVVDTIVAFYRPGDGIDCNGDRIPEPET